MDERAARWPVLNRDQIKYIAMFTMLLNHIANIFMEPGGFWTQVLMDIGYFTAPVMCWFLVEGYGYTHSKRQYALRLAGFAALSELPFCLAFSHGTALQFYGMNMIFTLLVCFCILEVRQRMRPGPVRNTALAGLVLLTVVIPSDWALMAPCYTLLFAWAKGSRRRTAQAFGWAMVLFAAVSLLSQLGLLASLGGALGVGLAGFAILFLYNGKRAEKGRRFSQWFFYLFYPVHLLILGLIRVALL